jgi:hypothetical protein
MEDYGNEVNYIADSGSKNKIVVRGAQNPRLRR